MKPTSRKPSPGVVYLNGFFNAKYSIFPHMLARLGFWGRIHVLLAPRGEFSPGALEIKASKKLLFIRLFKLSGAPTRTIWHASTVEEVDNIRAVMGDRSTVLIRENETSLPARAIGVGIASCEPSASSGSSGSSWIKLPRDDLRVTYFEPLTYTFERVSARLSVHGPAPGWWGIALNARELQAGDAVDLLNIGLSSQVQRTNLFVASLFGPWQADSTGSPGPPSSARRTRSRAETARFHCSESLRFQGLPNPPPSGQNDPGFQLRNLAGLIGRLL